MKPKNSVNFLERPISDERFYVDVTNVLTSRANTTFTNGVFEDSRVNIEPHRPYTLEEAKERLDDHVASATRKLQKQPEAMFGISPVPTALSTQPSAIPGYRTNSMFYQVSASRGPGVVVEAEMRKDDKPRGSKKG
jgi:hypothetical protein